LKAPEENCSWTLVYATSFSMGNTPIKQFDTGGTGYS